jgi:hypothetical protein
MFPPVSAWILREDNEIGRDAAARGNRWPDFTGGRIIGAEDQRSRASRGGEAHLICNAPRNCNPAGAPVHLREQMSSAVQRLQRKTGCTVARLSPHEIHQAPYTSLLHFEFRISEKSAIRNPNYNPM